MIIVYQLLRKEEIVLTITTMTMLLSIGLLTGGITILYLLLNRYDHPLCDYIMLSLFCGELAMLAYLVELNATSLDAKLTAIQFGYLGKLLINPLLVCFVLRYYEIAVHWIWQLLITIPAVIMQFFIFRCKDYTYYYESIAIGPNGLIQVEPGPLYLVNMSYSFFLSALFLGIILYRRKTLRKDAKRLNTMLLGAGILPNVCLLIYLMGLTNSIDLTPIGIMLGTLILTYAILKFGLLNRDALLQNMSTAIILLDSEGHLTFANPAAYHLLPNLDAPMFRKRQTNLDPLLSDQLAFVSVGLATYQRKVTHLRNQNGSQGTLITYDDVTEIKARLNRDAMTGLLNHASFYQTLEHDIKHAVEQHTPLSVAIADIDSFKRINDNFGHANGDTILISLAHLLKDCCKGLDVFRYGGEEFAVIFHSDYQTSEEIMKKALARFSAMRFKFLDTPVTFSFGTAEYDGSETAVSLFDRADQLMYTRKKELHRREQLEQKNKQS